MSGGLKARGHPVGGTGLVQIAELYLQLTGSFPNPRAQVLDGRVGLAQSIGGPGNNNYVTLIERSDNRREVARLDALRPRPLEKPALTACPPAALHGKRARIEAATTIHVTASGSGPLHVALLSIGGRRVFAKFDAPAGTETDALTAMAGKRARFLVKDDGDHYFQVEPTRWDLATLWKQLVGRVWHRDPTG